MRPRLVGIAILLHWLMALLIAAAYATIELRELFPRGSDPREALKAWHYTIGMWVFALLWLRMALRLVLGGSNPANLPPRWQKLAAGAVHLGLYLFMLTMPLLGWLTLSAEGDAMVWVGLEWPPLVGENEALAERFEALHETLGRVGYVLIGVHTAAALFHHYVLKDRVLAGMLAERPA
jgi:cytochrome b561